MNRFEKKFYNYSLIFDEAFISLLKENNYEDINVSMLCDKAGLNRSTFYSHYENMDDVLKETIRNTMMASSVKTSRDEFKLSDIKSYLNYVKNNQKMYKIYLAKLSKYKDKQKYDIENLIISSFHKANIKNKEEIKYRSAFYLGGIINILNTWLDNNCDLEIDTIYNYIRKSILRN